MSFTVTDHPEDTRASWIFWRVVTLKFLLILLVVTAAYATVRRPKGRPLEVAPTSRPEAWADKVKQL